MILTFDKPKKIYCAPVKKPNWEDEFKATRYKIHYDLIQAAANKRMINTESKKGKQLALQKVTRLINSNTQIKTKIKPAKKKSLKYSDQFQMEEEFQDWTKPVQQQNYDTHGYYSSYISISKNVKTLDQFQIMFPVLRKYVESANMNMVRWMQSEILKEWLTANKKRLSLKQEPIVMEADLASQSNTQNNRMRTRQRPQIQEIEQENIEKMHEQKRIQYQNHLLEQFIEMSAIDARDSLDEVRKLLNPCLDDLKCIILYQQLSKYGTGIAKELHQKYSPDTRFDVFLSKVLDASNYLNNNGAKINKILTLSVQKNQQINQITLAKTMKSMFCSVCLIYDCELHKFPDYVIIENKYDFMSPKNITPISKKVENAIKLCLIYNSIEKQNNKEQQKKQKNRQDTFNYQEMFQQQQVDKIFEIQKKDQPCCQKCYLNLNSKNYEKLRKQTGFKCSAPLARSILNIGIKMFNYDPCKISKLFQSSKIGITCDLIFIYLFQDYHLFDRLQHKFYQDQVEELRQFEKYEQENAQSLVPPPRRKKKKQEESNFNIFNQAGLQQPMCYHYFLEKNPQDIFCINCVCNLRGFCTQQCLCSPKCPLRRKGCDCKGKQQCKTKNCACYTQKMECQPGICVNCFDCPDKSVSKRNCCRNDEIIRGKCKIMRIGRSNIPMAGLGCFAGQFIQQNQLVKLYQGQVISYEVQNFRQKVKLDDTLYNFQLIQNGQSIDSRFIGNKSRFINHGNKGQTNLEARHVFSKGVLNMGLYSQRDIEKNEELFFNYDGSGSIYAKHRKKYPFIKKGNNNK